MIIEWWHWEVAGLALVLLELAIPAFFVIWFGFGAMLVGLALLVSPGLGLPAQIGLWVAASVAMAVLWFRVFRRSDHKTLVGTAAGEVIGEVGLLVEQWRPSSVAGCVSSVPSWARRNGPAWPTARSPPASG